MQARPHIIIHIGSDKKSLSLDSVSEGSVQEARKLTRDFFSTVKPSAPFSGKTIWAFYDRFFVDVALPYTKYRQLLEQCRSAELVQYSGLTEEILNVLVPYCTFYEIPLRGLRTPLNSKLQSSLGIVFGFLWRSFLTLYSLVSLFYFFILPAPKGRVAVWTGDCLGPAGFMDPRLGDLESRLSSAGISVVPLVRSTGVTYRRALKNFFQRKGKPVVYYEYLNWFFTSFFFFLPAAPTKKTSFFETALDYQWANEARRISTQEAIWGGVFKLIRIQSLVAWFLSFRTACLIWGARNSGVPGIGFMHGMSVLTFMGHEFMPEYEGPPIGTDVFGTWSEWWKDYFLKNAKIYPQPGIQVSGPLRPAKPQISHFKQKSNTISVFIVAEAHLPVEQLAPYLEQVLNQPGIQLTFKIRPFGVDPFWERFSKHPLNKKYQFAKSNQVSPECFADADVVIGTHSTAVLEALALNKPILFLNTPKWGDYFDLNSQFHGNCPFWVNSPEEFEKKIHEVARVPQDWGKLFDQYFGNKLGNEWILEKIRMFQKS